MRPLILYCSEFLTETRDTHTLAVSQSGTLIGSTCTTDYATVLFPLPGNFQRPTSEVKTQQVKISGRCTDSGAVYLFDISQIEGK